MTVEWIILWCALLIYALWPLYVFTMAMLRAKEDGKTNVFAWILAAPIVLTALLLDVMLNYTLFAILTWDFPRMEWRGFNLRVEGWFPKVQFPVEGEWTFSQRLSRLAKDATWKGSVARWLAEMLLDPYSHDGEPHIKR